MKLFKQLDLWMNVALILCLGLSALSRMICPFHFYYIVGAWQVFSMIVHGCSGWFMQKGGRRRVFHNTVIIIGVLVVLSNWVEPFLLIFLFLLLFSPIMAIIYTIMCFDECLLMKERPLSKLK